MKLIILSIIILSLVIMIIPISCIGIQDIFNKAKSKRIEELE